MKREYDFSKAVRGKFHRKGAELRLPIYLDAKVQEQLEREARKKGKDSGEMVNQLVQQKMELIQKLTLALGHKQPHCSLVQLEPDGGSFPICRGPLG